MTFFTFSKPIIFMGNASVDAAHADLFLEAMRYTLILFGSLNMLALCFGIRRTRRT